MLNDKRIANLENSGESTPLLVPYIGQSPSYASGSTSYAGFVLNDVAGVIGKGTSFKSRILFHELNNGLIAINSTLLVTNSTFKDIQPDNTYAGANGYGITSIGGNNASSSLIQYGLGQNSSTATFSNCRTAIFARHSHIESSENNMEGVTYGYRMDFLENFHRARIFNNTIHALFYGAGLHSNDYCKNIELHDNTINVADPDGNANVFRTGIGVWESNFSGLNHDYRLRILNNAIHAGENATENISLYNVRDVLVSDNTLDLDDPGNTGSLSLHYNFRPTLACNVITGFSQAPNVFCIFSLLTGDGAYSCNHTTNTSKGLYFDMDCANSLLQGNEMINHDIGLEVGGNLCQIGPQYHNGNRWTGTSSNLGALHHEPLIAVFQPILVSTTSPFGAADHEPSSSDPNNWIYPDNQNINDYNCSTATNPCFEMDLIKRFGAIDSLLAIGDIPLENFETEQYYVADRQLFERRALNTTLEAPDVVDSFYNANVSTNIGRFYRLAIGMKALDSLSGNYHELIKHNDSLNKVLLMQMDSNNTSIYNGIDSVMLMEENRVLSAQINSNSILLNQWLVISDSLLTDLADSLVVENNNITPSGSMEENEQTVNNIYLTRTIKKQLPDSAEKIVIDEISSLCILEGGIATIKARGIRATYNDTTSYDDFTDCLETGNNSRHSQTQTPLKQVAFVFPNPTHGPVTIKIPEEIEDINIKVFNTMHEVVYSNNLSGLKNHIKLDLSFLLNGVYLIKTKPGTGGEFNNKIVIIR